MQIIDLSHLIHSEMCVYPGSQLPSFKAVHILEREGFRETKMTFYSHIGTHIDAPAHMLKEGKYLDHMPISSFFGKAAILDFTNYKRQGQVIEPRDLMQHQEKISKAEFVILKTGWDHYWDDKKYFEHYPYLSDESAQWLSAFHLKGVGIDAISIDRSDTTDFIVHKILLSKNILIIENLTNLNGIKNEFFTLSALPLKYKNAEASPVRAIAIENS